MPSLTDFQRDAISELLNIGMGRAADALSQMAHEEVQLSVPFVDLLPVKNVTQLLGKQAGHEIGFVMTRQGNEGSGASNAFRGEHGHVRRVSVDDVDIGELSREFFGTRSVGLDDLEPLGVSRKAREHRLGRSATAGYDHGP